MQTPTRRRFLKCLTGAALAGITPPWRFGNATDTRLRNVTDHPKQHTATLFLCGDVMTGRGIDQVLPHSVHPRLHEPYIRNARAYLNLAEHHSGTIATPVDYDYIWGDALSMLQQFAPAARIINLETAVTTSDDFWPDKAVHYRMHPANTPCLTVAAIDCCVLANNHVLDWGYKGLEDTLESLRATKIATAGAGNNAETAATPAIIDIPGGRVLVFGYGHAGSGIPHEWQAGTDRAGVNLLTDLSLDTAASVAQTVNAARQPGDIVIVSIHWGSNWGYPVPLEQQRFARALIDQAGVDIVHGHSSHHPKGIEIHNNRLILYGCGDFINDYEGIEGHEDYRSELSLMYFPTLYQHTGELISLNLIPLRIKRFRLQHANDGEVEWLLSMINRESRDWSPEALLTDNNIIVIPANAGTG